MFSSENDFVHVVNLLGLQIESDLAKFDERDTSGATPAHYAAAQGNNLCCMLSMHKIDLWLCFNLQCRQC